MNRRFVLVVVLVLVIDWLAFLRGRARVDSWSQCAILKSWRLSMNRPTPDRSHPTADRPFD